MKSLSFEYNKIRRLLRTRGVSYTFYRDTLDEFKEPNGREEVATFAGVFHEVVNHVLLTTADSATVQSKQTPYILALYEDAKAIKQDDYTYIDGQKYVVNGTVNTAKWGVSVDISLEAVV